MHIHKHFTKPSRQPRTNFNSFFREISEDWEGKAARLQARRWEKLNRELDRL